MPESPRSGRELMSTTKIGDDLIHDKTVCFEAILGHTAQAAY